MKRLSLIALLLLAGFAPAQDKPAHGKGYKPLSPEKAKALHAERFKKHGYMMRDLTKNVTPPAEFDCKDLNWCVDAGDQAQCGSCYLYSTVKGATDSAIKAGVGKLGSFRLSTQYGMDCHDFGGCDGGNGTEVIDWMCKNGWYAEADPSQDATLLYPLYEARSGRCRVPQGAKKYTPKSWAFITGDQGDHPATVEEFKVALLTYGMVNIALDAGGQFGNYTSGVIDGLGRNIDHEINVRGWSDAKQALLLENQWKGWGGAKSPGDNCAWLSYKAVGALQDPFTVLFETPTPPPVPPGPTPPVPPVPPVPPGPGPTPGVPVSIALTPDQVASVNAQSGALVLSGATTMQQIVDMVNSQSGNAQVNKNMTLQQIMDAINKAPGQPPVAVEAKSCCGQSPEPPKESKDADRLKKLEADNADIRRAVDAILKALLEK